MRRLAHVMLVLLVLPRVWAKEPDLSGKTTNLAGLGLPGVRVSLATADQKVTLATAVSASDGSYEFHDLKPAKYVVFAELSGFLPSARTTIDLSTVPHAVANLTLVPQTAANGAPALGTSGLSAAGIRGSIDAGGYSAPATMARSAGLLERLAKLDDEHAACLQNPARSIEILRTAIERDPQALKPRLTLGVAEFLAGREHESLDTLLRAVELAPTDPLPYFLLAEAATPSAPRIVEIRARLKSLVESSPKDPEAYFHYAQTLQGEGEAPLRAAIALKPHFARAHSSLAVLLEQRGEYAQAIAAYEESLRFAPDAPETLYRLAQVYQRTGQAERARETLALFTVKRDRQKSEIERKRTAMQELIPAPCEP